MLSHISYLDIIWTLKTWSFPVTGLVLWRATSFTLWLCSLYSRNPHPKPCLADLCLSCAPFIGKRMHLKGRAVLLAAPGPVQIVILFLCLSKRGREQSEAGIELTAWLWCSCLITQLTLSIYFTSTSQPCPQPPSSCSPRETRTHLAHTRPKTHTNNHWPPLTPLSSVAVNPHLCAQCRAQSHRPAGPAVSALAA